MLACNCCGSFIPTSFPALVSAEELNTMLGGGFDSQAITELHGEWRTGKTQICHTLCITCQIPKDGSYSGGRVVYIDTEGTAVALLSS